MSCSCTWQGPVMEISILMITADAPRIFLNMDYAKPEVLLIHNTAETSAYPLAWGLEAKVLVQSTWEEAQRESQASPGKLPPNKIYTVPYHWHQCEGDKMTQMAVNSRQWCAPSP